MTEPVVVEIRCLCHRNVFDIRSKVEKKTKTCHLCLRQYELHNHLNGNLTVYILEPGEYVDRQLERQHWSDVTNGE